jgi:hypothetical protein
MYTLLENFLAWPGATSLPPAAKVGRAVASKAIRTKIVKNFFIVVISLLIFKNR